MKSSCTEEATQQSSAFHQYMRDVPVEFRRDDMVVSTDRKGLDPDAVLALLHTTFWAQGMTRDVLARAIANSVSFGLFDHSLLVGFGRAVTDLATYAYWTDVVIAPSHRGRRLGGELVYMERRA